MDPILKEIFDRVLEADKESVQLRVREALAQGLLADAILEQGLIGAMREVGRRFESGLSYIPEMLASAKSMEAGLAIIKPNLREQGVKGAGRVALGTVKGDLHDIGKHLVGMMLEGAGYEVIDLGVDVAPEAFALAVREKEVDVVGMSALLTTTMMSMKETIEALEDIGVRSAVKVIIGGAPVTQEFASEIRADGYASDASRAVRLVNSLLAAE